LRIAPAIEDGVGKERFYKTPACQVQPAAIPFPLLPFQLIRYPFVKRGDLACG
jgi:hypothetical protein